MDRRWIPGKTRIGKIGILDGNEREDDGGRKQGQEVVLAIVVGWSEEGR